MTSIFAIAKKKMKKNEISLFHMNILVICLLTCLTFSFLLCGCSTGKSSKAASGNNSQNPDPAKSKATHDNTPVVLEPSADGRTLFENEYGAIDASNTSQGYIMAKFTANCKKVKFQIEGPDSINYTYSLQAGGDWTVFPLSAGSGKYTFLLLENIDGDSYGVDMTETLDVLLENEKLPFLYPNQYVNFNKKSKIVAKGAELAEDASSDLEVIENIYNFMIENITYDTKKAENLTYGYIPDCDQTLETGSGICFDYASTMCAMLRTQGIPTKLEVGYSSDVYHAWISTYIEEIGWVDNIIQFNGSDWELIDPTLAANNKAKDAADYMGDGSNYLVKYHY